MRTDDFHCSRGCRCVSCAVHARQLVFDLWHVAQGLDVAREWPHVKHICGPAGSHPDYNVFNRQARALSHTMCYCCCCCCPGAGARTAGVCRPADGPGDAARCCWACCALHSGAADDHRVKLRGEACNSSKAAFGMLETAPCSVGVQQQPAAYKRSLGASAFAAERDAGPGVAESALQRL